MDELERVFKDNKNSFDRITPNNSLWDSINEGLDENDRMRISPKNKSKVFFLKIAVILVLFVGGTTLFIFNNKDTPAFENVSLTSPEGEKILLDPSLNEFTLVQFWASGNVLCDELNCYYYLPAYEKYKDRGFEIYAISLDKDKRKWIESIKENGLPWIHVSDLKGWESPICSECDITKIPTSFLIDKKGEIVAKDLNAESLDATLNFLLAQNN